MLLLAMVFTAWLMGRELPGNVPMVGKSLPMVPRSTQTVLTGTAPLMFSSTYVFCSLCLLVPSLPVSVVSALSS